MGVQRVTKNGDSKLVHFIIWHPIGPDGKPLPETRRFRRVAAIQTGPAAARDQAHYEKVSSIYGDPDTKVDAHYMRLVGEAPKVKEYTLNDLATMYVASTEYTDLKASTRYLKSGYLFGHRRIRTKRPSRALLPTFGHTKAQDWHEDGFHWVEFNQFCRKEGFGYDQKRNACITLCSLLQWAWATPRKLIHKMVLPARPPIKRAVHTYPTAGNVTLALAGAADPMKRLAILTAIYTGARKGELRAAKKEHFHLDRPIGEGVWLLQKNMWKGVIDTPKGGVSREIPLHPDLHRAMLDWFKESKCQYVFHTKGRAVGENWLNLAVNAACDKSGIRRIPPHWFRHFRITKWAMEGVGVYELQRRAGHVDVKTTQRYIHIAEEWLKTTKGHGASLLPQLEAPRADVLVNSYFEQLQALELSGQPSGIELALD